MADMPAIATTARYRERISNGDYGQWFGFGCCAVWVNEAAETSRDRARVWTTPGRDAVGRGDGFVAWAVVAVHCGSRS